MRKMLSMVLARHVGETLTLELATSMAREIMGMAGQPVDAARFEPKEIGSYRVSLERMAEIRPEIEALQRRHYEETEQDVERRPFDCDYDTLLAMEEAGRLLQFTGRDKDTGELVASLMIYLHRSVSNQSLYSQEGELYVTPEHRGGFLVVRMWQYAEDVMRAIGVSESTCESRLNNGADRLARFMGYKPQAIRFSKRLDGKEAS